MSLERLARRAIDACAAIEWRDKIWRTHLHGERKGSMRTAVDFEYTRHRTSGRWHLGKDCPETSRRFAALYCSEFGQVSQLEVRRHAEHEARQMGEGIRLRDDRYRTSELEVHLSCAYDLRGLETSGIECDDLCEDFDYRLPQQLAAEAYRRGADGLVVWSCAADPLGTHTNIIVFPDHLTLGRDLHETGRWMAMRPFRDD